MPLKFKHCTHVESFHKASYDKNNILLAACDNLEVLKYNGGKIGQWPMRRAAPIMKILTIQRGVARQKMGIRLRVISTFKFLK
jgi:hypothetical protein